MQQQNAWIPVMASLGIGAAAYYTMTKGGRGVGSTLQQAAVPFLSGMSGGQSKMGGSSQSQVGGQQMSGSSQSQMGGQQMGSSGSSQMGSQQMSNGQSKQQSASQYQ